jgi:hypothetical protein
MKKSYMRPKKILKWIAFPLLIVFILARFYYALTDDFRLSNITFPLPYKESWSVTPLDSEHEKQLEKIFSQPFYYLGKGAQSYVFSSEDRQYVLKFFKFKHLRPSVFIDTLPSIGLLKTYKDKQNARKQRKLFGVFESYKLAYDMDKNESGLIFIQLNTEGNPKRLITLYDKINLKREVDLQHYPFIVQKKGETLRVILSRLFKDGDITTVKERLGQILDLYAGEYNKGLYDHDHGIMQNTGFIGDIPIHLDVGKLLRDKNKQNKHDARKDATLVVNNINIWVKKHYSQYSEEIADYLKTKIDILF